MLILNSVMVVGKKTVTYADHFVSGSPEWKINATWLQRVSDVVDLATSRGLYVITNMHHGEFYPTLGTYKTTLGPTRSHLPEGRNVISI